MICKKCKKFFFEERGAISREDNQTLICSECGTVEAIQDFLKFVRKEENQ